MIRTLQSYPSASFISGYADNDSALHSIQLPHVFKIDTNCLTKAIMVILMYGSSIATIPHDVISHLSEKPLMDYQSFLFILT